MPKPQISDNRLFISQIPLEAQPRVRDNCRHMSKHGKWNSKEVRHLQESFERIGLSTRGGLDGEYV